MTPKSLLVRDAMRIDPVCLLADTPVMQAVAWFIEHNISGAPVVDQHKTLLGILTERDCIRVAIQSYYYDEPAGSVGQYMNTKVFTVSPDDNLLTVAERFMSSPYRRFPVITQSRVIGIISRRDVLRFLSGNVPLTP